VREALTPSQKTQTFLKIEEPTKLFEREHTMAVTLTDAAANHVSGMLAKRGHGLGLRVGTKKSGCTGFAYVVDYADEVGDDDEIFESHGVKVIVDATSLGRIDGTEVDFVKHSLLNEGFEFRNPKVTNQCGCGESFSVE